MASDKEFGLAGYARLCGRHSIRCLPNHIRSIVVQRTRSTETKDGLVTETYPKSYWPGEGDFGHLEFALKREGVHLQLLRELLPRLPVGGLVDYVRSKPTSAYARRIWLLFEQFTGKRVEALGDVQKGNYADLLAPDEYFTGERVRSKRHRINVNLPGTWEFCPLVRKTGKIADFQSLHLAGKCLDFLDTIPRETYGRALQYMYTKETKSSYAIEREKPDQVRARDFAEALKGADRGDYLEKSKLVGLQNLVVDPRFADEGWRDTKDEQVYVGRSLSNGEEEIHFVAPRPQEIGELMDAYLDAAKRILGSDMDPVVAAAIVSYAFVFLHPFSDGNGRIHRFLIHYVLTRKKFAPEGVLFPVSATMLNRMGEYDASLESFSKHLMPLVDFELDHRGRMKVNNDTRDHYRHMDLTQAAEALYAFVEETINEEMPSEIRFLHNYDQARVAMKGVVDLPNRHADLFVKLCLQNNGKLSKAKRGLEEFRELTEEEIRGLEEVVAEAFSDV